MCEWQAPSTHGTTTHSVSCTRLCKFKAGIYGCYIYEEVIAQHIDYSKSSLQEYILGASNDFDFKCDETWLSFHQKEPKKFGRMLFGPTPVYHTASEVFGSIFTFLYVHER